MGIHLSCKVLEKDSSLVTNHKIVFSTPRIKGESVNIARVGHH